MGNDALKEKISFGSMKGIDVNIRGLGWLLPSLWWREGTGGVGGWGKSQPSVGLLCPQRTTKMRSLGWFWDLEVSQGFWASREFRSGYSVWVWHKEAFLWSSGLQRRRTSHRESEHTWVRRHTCTLTYCCGATKRIQSFFPVVFPVFASGLTCWHIWTHEPSVSINKLNFCPMGKKALFIWGSSIVVQPSMCRP